MKAHTPRPILVVDDDEQHLRFLRESLQSAGYEVITAQSAGEAFRKIRDKHLSVILTELRLPAASGLDVLDEARRVDPLTVGIVLTGHASIDSTLVALRQGAYDYLVKPCSPSSLAAAARRGMEHYRLKRALVEQNAQVEKLELRLEDKSRMIQNVSHELKNPLSVVCGYSAFLLSEPQDHKPEDLRKSLQSIHDNAQRLNDLLEELLDSSRLAAHKIQLEYERITAESMAMEAAEDGRLEARSRQIELSWECAADTSCVNADRKRAHQILSNLLANAMKFTPAGGSVKLLVEREGNFVRFCIKDTGMGIPPEDMPHLFERFYQAKNAKPAHQGLGLGLEICRGLVELHGGRIWAESGLSVGSSFYFTLPAAES